MGKDIIILLDKGIHGENPFGGGQFCRQEVFKVIRNKIDAHYVFITHKDNALAKEARNNFDQVIILDYVYFEKYRYLVKLWNVFEVLKLLVYLIKGSNKLLNKINKLIKEQNAQRVIVFPNENYSRLIFLLVKLRKWRKCVGVMIVDNEYNKGMIDKIFIQLFCRTYSEIFSASKAVVGPYLKYRKVEVVYPGVDIEALLAMRNGCVSSGNYTTEKENAFKICLIGSLIELKRPHIAIEVTSKLIHREKYNVILNVIGSGPLLSELKTLTVTLNLKEGRDVFFWGHLSKKDTIRILDASDILIHASDSESFGRAVAEAQVIGKPVVVPRVAALPEIIVDKVTGFVVQKDNIEEYVEKVKILADNLDLKKEMGQKAFYFAKKFDIKYTAMRYGEAFSKYIRAQRLE